MIDAKCTVVFWIADWFAQLNGKMGGDLSKIRTVGKYMIEIWKACGMPVDNGKVQFLWASEEINKRSELYWTLVMDICSTFNITRLKRCTKILGRTEASEEIDKLLENARSLKQKFVDGVEGIETTDILSAFEAYESALEKNQNESMPTAYLL